MSGTTNTLSPPAPATNGATSPHQVSADQVKPGNNGVPNSDRGFISWTQLSTFRRCPLRYYFRYVERLPEEFVASSLLFGSGIQAAAELHYRRLLAGDSPPDIDEMLGAFWDEWNERSEKCINVARGCGSELQSSMLRMTGGTNPTTAQPETRSC